jgi:Ser/Thr protein kinase RdoA (MazF antagonist)
MSQESARPTVAHVAVTYSTASPQTLVDQVLSAYPAATIGVTRSCRLLMGVSALNDTYLVVTDAARWILKVYRADWRSYGEVQYELDLLAHLNQRGVAVALPVARRDGHRITTLRMPEGPRQAVLYAFAPGRPFRWPFFHDEGECRVAGRALAALHDAADDFVSPWLRPVMNLEALLDRPLAELEPYLLDRPHDWEYLVKLSERLRQRLTTLVAAGLDWGVCHGDYQPGNASIAEDAGVTIYDFDAGGPGWRMLDLTAYHKQCAEGDQGRKIWQAFLDGYTGVRRGGQGVSPADLAAVPVLVAAGEIYALGFKARGITKTWWDSWWLPYSELDVRIPFLRRWEAEFLG